MAAELLLTRSVCSLMEAKKKYKSQKYRFLRCFSLLPFNDPLHFLQWILNNPVV